MGQCGCGDYRGGYKFKGPGNIIYVIEIYQPCMDCESPAGVTIHKFGKEEQEFWDVDSEKDLEFNEIGMANLPVLDPKKLKERAAGYFDEYDMDDFINNEFVSAWADTLEEWENRKR